MRCCMHTLKSAGGLVLFPLERTSRVQEHDSINQPKILTAAIQLAFSEPETSVSTKPCIPQICQA